MKIITGGRESDRGCLWESRNKMWGHLIRVIFKLTCLRVEGLREVLPTRGNGLCKVKASFQAGRWVLLSEGLKTAVRLRTERE